MKNNTIILIAGIAAMAYLYSKYKDNKKYVGGIKADPKNGTIYYA